MLADDSLGAHDSLRDGRFRHQEGARDLGGGQTSYQSQRQRDATFGRQRGMTADEDQAQPVVGNRRGIVIIHFGF